MIVLVCGGVVFHKRLSGAPAAPAGGATGDREDAAGVAVHPVAVADSIAVVEFVPTRLAEKMPLWAAIFCALAVMVVLALAGPGTRSRVAKIPAICYRTKC